MNESITVTVTRSVWLSSYHTPSELMDRLESGDAGSVVNMLTIYGEPDKDKWSDYTRIGEADVTVRLLPRDEQTRLAITSLNQKLNQLRAAYLEKQQEIMQQISNLQALTNEVA